MRLLSAQRVSATERYQHSVENHQPVMPNRSIALTAIVYAGISALFLAFIALVLWFGKSIEIGNVGQVVRDAADGSGHSSLSHLLIALTSIIVLGRIMGRLFAAVGQPRVMGEMVAGIMLGPSFLGLISPAAMRFIMPTEIGPQLGIISQLGIILYMFLVGLELNGELLRSRAHTTIAISHMSIFVPFLLGVFLALSLYPPFAPPGTPFSSFALFMGIAMSITAFPVLARILAERGLEKTPLGVIALSCAAVDDVTAWCILALILGVAQSAVGNALSTIACALGYIAVMLFVVRPLAVRYLAHDHSGGQHNPALVLTALLLSALTTEWIGVHALFGAFLLGAVIPHDSNIAEDFCHKLEDIVHILLLPAFFAYTGMRTEIGLMHGWQIWSYTALIVFIATLGKFGGTYAAARFTGLDWRTSASLGALMNTRGLMQLIVLNIGLELGVLSPALFAMFVIMALATTLTTTPILDRLVRPATNPDYSDR